MAALLLSLLAVGGTPAAPSDPSDLPEVIGYDEFKLAFGRRFDASDDATALEASRRGHFEDTVAFIRAHNAEADAGLHTFRCGVNQYADLSPGEFRALLGNRPSVQRPPVAEELARVDAGAIPPTVDWRTKNAVSPVKNQGQCGACWAFSVTGAVEGAYAIATGALRSLSEQQLMDCDIQNSGCQGGNQANGFSYVFSNKGLDTEKEYTYDGGNDPCWVAAEKRVAASIDGSSAVPASNETALAAAVAQVPVSVSVQATTAFRNYKVRRVFPLSLPLRLLPAMTTLTPLRPWCCSAPRRPASSPAPRAAARPWPLSITRCSRWDTLPTRGSSRTAGA